MPRHTGAGGSRVLAPVGFEHRAARFRAGGVRPRAATADCTAPGLLLTFGRVISGICLGIRVLEAGLDADRQPPPDGLDAVAHVAETADGGA